MKSPTGNYLNIGRRLTLTLALLVALILGGNGLVILQFERARFQTARLTGVSQQLIAVLRLQESLLSFHQRLNELAASKDAHRLVAEAEPLRAALQEQTQQTRSTLAYLPSEFRVDPAFLTALDTIEITLPFQLQDIAALATAGDWEAVRLRLDNELKRIETMTSAHVKSINRDLDEELPRAVANMKNVQRRILLIMPATAISTVLVAAFFGWAIARRLLELRLEERVNERTRIARELHDTLLQSFHGLMFRFQAARNMLPRRPEEAIQALDGALDTAEQAVAEGRDAIQDLRSVPAAQTDLAQLLTATGQNLARSPDASLDSATFRVTVEGEQQVLSPILQDEVYRIAREALRNAFRHAHARKIEADIRYDDSSLRLRIRDDGTGIDPKVLEDGGRPGHWGLLGIHERAKRIGARLDLWSEAGAGTEVELTVPASVAYGTSRSGPGFRLFRKKEASG
jgi:signal transduction histidine kinase